MRRLFVTFLISFAVLGVHRPQAQTLDELHRPLLNKNQATVDIDYGQFTVESRVASVNGSDTYFEPPHHSLVPGAGFGISNRVQLNVSGTYLPPIRRSFSTFGDRSSVLHSRLMVKSLQAELVARPNDELEIGMGYLSGRSRYTVNYPYGNGTTSDERETTEMLQVRGVWLPQADRGNRPMRDDLDGLTAPLLRRHRTSIVWDAIWRRYSETENGRTPGYAGEVNYDIRSTDTRVRVGAGLGVTDRLQVTADGYWQPPFTVTELAEVSRLSGSEPFYDQSARFTGVSGWSTGARWRPAWLERYPAFILDRGSLLRSFRDFTDTAYRDSASVHVGLRLVL